MYVAHSEHKSNITESKWLTEGTSQMRHTKGSADGESKLWVD